MPFVGLGFFALIVGASFASRPSFSAGPPAAGRPGTAQEDPRVEIISLRYHTHPNFTRIVLDIGKLREYTSGELKEPDRIFVDVLQARLNPILHGQSYPIKTDYLSLIRVAQKNPSTVRVTMEVDMGRLESYRIYHLFDPFRLVVDIYPREGLAGPGENPPAKAPSNRPADSLPSGYSMARQLGLGVRTIVLDPGHGGTDPGCIGKSGLQEKSIVLDVALMLRKKLVEQNNFNVILTRETDIYIPLEDRTVIANQKAADLFVSIHVNSKRNRKRTGIETYYLNFSPDADVNELAARENATSTGNIGRMKEIIDKIVKNSKFQESKDLAEKIHRNLIKSISAKYGPAKSLRLGGGPFYVLIGSEMPAVLAEISHLSNAQEESRLKTKEYREVLVDGIYSGIIEYIRSLGKG
jgi:N-acetylmuramoyl-L-alanine amidase